MSPAADRRTDDHAVDAGLVRSAQAGDRAAMERLLRRHHDRLHAVCCGVVGQSDADDATQATLMSIVGGLARFDHRARFSTWSHRIAVNAALDELRRRARRPQPHDPIEGGGDARHPHRRELEALRATSKQPMDPRADAPEGSLDHGDPAQRVVDRQVVEAALAGLSDDFRVPLVLAEYGALEYAEIAEALEIPVGTVRSRNTRARRHLGYYGESLR